MVDDDKSDFSHSSPDKNKAMAIGFNDQIQRGRKNTLNCGKGLRDGSEFAF